MHSSLAPDIPAPYHLLHPPRIPDALPLDRAAPRLCAGITTYSPLRHFGVETGDAVAIVGLGDLGHMGGEPCHLPTGASVRAPAPAAFA